MVGPTLAQVLALVLHELCTNATKYGALRVEGGVISVTWLVAVDELHLKWVETGGPPPEAERFGGFGLTFVSNLLRNVDGKITSHFRQEGAAHSIIVNLRFQDASRDTMKAG
jgi:two-component sensor histidine kinase